MSKLFIIISGLFGMTGVGLGAFGAHALHSFLEKSNRLDTYETAVKYQFYHALALLLIGLLMESSISADKTYLQYAGWAMIFGVCVFSISLYALCFTGITMLGAITPIGGLGLIAGWGLLVMSLLISRA